MRGINTTRHQTVSTWTVELLTVLAVTVGLTQYLSIVLSFGALITVFSLSVFGVGFALVRVYLGIRMFGGLA